MSETMPDQSLWRNHRFVRLFAAHVVSLVGSGLSSVALGLLAHQLVGASASAVLGITLAIRIVVIILCAPWAGWVSDRIGPRTALIASGVLVEGIECQVVHGSLLDPLGTEEERSKRDG